MNKIVLRPLKAFLCHASGDKPPVRELYKRLVFEGIDAWLDQEKLLPGQDWRVEIPRAVEGADVVIVCLSKKSVTKEGYVQKEIKFALDIAEEKPDGTIFLIPARLEDCPVPERLARWHWVDLYDENGYLKLLQSLKLRAEKVGAAVTQTLYEDDDKERERRLDQYYTEGLAAFYTEDWDKACRRFQSILSEQPNHKNAAEKLEEAERQRDLSKLYSQSIGAYQAEDWQAAIKTLEELLKKSAEYKDAAQLLRNSRKQKQIKELYAEAQKLHSAEKWQAVLKVFDQILVIDPAHPDPDGILPSAQREVAELKRLADLNELYSRAVHEMDSGNWLEARRVLEQVHKTQTGFLETERLLKKVENEIIKIEDIDRCKNQVNTLYEQAHGLMRSKKWRKVIDKLEEIRVLDEQFIDSDGIFTKAKEELEHEDKETQRQNELAAKYAEAVRLLHEEKYQEALNKWQEVKAVDTKYPDRQRIQRTGRKKLDEMETRIKRRSGTLKSRLVWTGIGGILLVALAITLRFTDRPGLFLSPVTSTPSSTPTLQPSATTLSLLMPLTSTIPPPSALPYPSVTPPPSATPFTSYFWGFEDNRENWGSKISDVTSPFIENGYLTFETTGNDPYIYSPNNLNIDAEITPIITIQMRITRGYNGAIYFVTNKDNNWDELKTVRFFTKNIGNFQTYNIVMSSISSWKDVITQFRLDPVDNALDVKVEIDYISVHAP